MTIDQASCRARGPIISVFGFAQKPWQRDVVKILFRGCLELEAVGLKKAAGPGG